MTIRARRSLIAGGAAATAVALAAAYVLVTAGPATARPFATLDVLQGEAEVATATGFRPAVDGETLHRGDTVRTTDSGRAQVEYFDGSVTRLDRGTTFTLSELASTQENTAIVGEQASGSTFNRVVELSGSQSRFDVETPSAIASVRGTTFFTQVERDGSGLVGVLEGELMVTGEAGASALVPGRGVTVTAEGYVSAPFVLTAAHLDSDWLFYNLCVLDHVQDACSRVEPSVQMPVEDEEPRPEPPPPTVQEAPVVQAPAGPPPELQKDENDEPPHPSIEEEDEPPPAPPPPPPPPPEPPDHPGNPPCDNPGQGTPCDGPGNAGNPPGNGNGNGGG